MQVHAACAPRTLPDTIAALLFQPFGDLHVALYRMLAALVARLWFAGAICGRSDLLARLLDPDSEAGHQASGGTL